MSHLSYDILLMSEVIAKSVKFMNNHQTQKKTKEKSSISQKETEKYDSKFMILIYGLIKLFISRITLRFYVMTYVDCSPLSTKYVVTFFLNKGSKFLNRFVMSGVAQWLACPLNMHENAGSNPSATINFFM